MANDCDLKSLMTLSSKSEGSTGPQLRKWRNAPLHDRCTIHDMVKLKDAFQNAYRNKLSPNEFRQLLKTLLNVEYDDDEFKILFMKINTNRTGEIDWDELVSHLLLGYFGNDPENQRDSLQPPIMGLPTVVRSHHRHPISRICFCPDVAKDRSTDVSQGTYVTVSRDGVINWWSLDMTLLRSAQSSSPHLKIRTTWVTDMVCMPDVNIIVTSSTERDLRFYDCTAKTFTLKMVITSWEFMICTLHYHFHKDANERCMLVCGDVGGNVRVLLFSPVGRGPFRNQAGRALQQLRHIDLIKKPHLLPEMKLVQLERVHSEWVRQVSYYASLHCVVSCATCTDSLLMCDVQGSKTYNVFHVEKGVQCFAFDEEAHVLLTGGPDCVVRVWNPFVPARASAELAGHHAAVTALVLQRGPDRLTAYSLARDRIIKVWDVHAHTCLQTYAEVAGAMGGHGAVCATYEEGSRTLCVGGARLAALVLDERAAALHSDGTTHARALAALLYNPLFKVVLSCGMDSIIINWDPLTGKRNAMVREAHTRQLHGELIPVEITAACFDPGYQLLLTGARDGSLKVWNFNTGVCLRMLSIEYMCEVTNCFWVEGRILAVGWNRRVTEFSDGGTDSSGGGGAGKGWEVRHTDDVLAAAARSPAVLATATYNSELILWKLETGQPYRQFLCSDPTRRIKMQYNKREARSPQPTARGRSTARSFSVSGGARTPLSSAAAVAKAQARRASSATRPARTLRPRPPAVHAMVFLLTRPATSRDASMFLSLESGQVQGWSEHPAGGMQGAFCGVHAPGDYVSALTTDPRDRYLFTGTTLGYIKVWLLTNYLTAVKQHVSMPQLRLEFPFLWRDRVEGRAKRRVRDQPLPLLLNSYRAHLRCVTCCAYIADLKLLLSGSSDYSVRVWRLSGQYVRTLGGVPPAPADLPQPRMPPDVLKVASSTTLKVWRGGVVSRYVPGQAAVDALRDITELELRTRTFGAPAPAPPLGRHLRLPARPDRQPPPALDASLPIIPLYAHLRMSWCGPVRRPGTPPLVRDTRLRADTARRAHFHPAPH